MKPSKGRSRKPILIVGTGGHARVVAALLNQLCSYRVVGCLDRQSVDQKEKISGHAVVGTWRDLAKFQADGITAAAIAIGDNKERSAMQERLKKSGFRLPALVHPSALMEPDVHLEDGVQICAGTILAAGVSVAEGTIINTGTIVDHESQLGLFTHVAPGCAIAGRVTIGEGTFLGIGVRVIDRITIGRWSIIGAGAVVLNNISDRTTAYGIPAKAAQRVS